MNRSWSESNPELYFRKTYNRSNIDELMVYISKFMRSKGRDLAYNEKIVGYEVIPSADGTVINIRAVIEQEEDNDCL